MVHSLFFIGILLSILAAYAAAYSLKELPVYQELRSRSQRFIALDGLRGYLALGVYLHHAVMYWYLFQTGEFSRPPEDIIQNLGKVSVAIFFLITGFLFTNKLLTTKDKIDWIKLYKGRIERLLPLYVFVLIIIASVVLIRTNAQLQVTDVRLVKDVLKWLLFHGGTVNGYADTGMIIAGVDWSLKYEWLFYFSLPFVSLLIRSKSLLLYAIITSLCIYGTLNSTYLFTFDSKFFLLFLLGGVVAKTYNKNQCRHRGPDWLHNCIFSLTLIAVMNYSKALDLWHCLMIGLIFYYFIAGQTLAGLLRHPASCILGEVSYSIYLLHGLILYLLFFHQPQTELFLDYPAVYFLVVMPVISAAIVYVSHFSFCHIEQWKNIRILQIPNIKRFSFYKES